MKKRLINYASDENKKNIQNDNHTNNFNQNNNIRFNDEKFVKSKISEIIVSLYEKIEITISDQNIIKGGDFSKSYIQCI